MVEAGVALRIGESGGEGFEEGGGVAAGFGG
jgi:hypothetical protein